MADIFTSICVGLSPVTVSSTHPLFVGHQVREKVEGCEWVLYRNIGRKKVKFELTVPLLSAGYLNEKVEEFMFNMTMDSTIHSVNPQTVIIRNYIMDLDQIQKITLEFDKPGYGTLKNRLEELNVSGYIPNNSDMKAHDFRDQRARNLRNPGATLHQNFSAQSIGLGGTNVVGRRTPVTSPFGPLNFHSGATALNTEDTALNSGATALNSGATALNSGATAFYSGATALLNSGATALNSGATALNFGATALNFGATALNFGATALNFGAAPSASTLTLRPTRGQLGRRSWPQGNPYVNQKKK